MHLLTKNVLENFTIKQITHIELNVEHGIQYISLVHLTIIWTAPSLNSTHHSSHRQIISSLTIITKILYGSKKKDELRKYYIMFWLFDDNATRWRAPKVNDKVNRTQSFIILSLIWMLTEFEHVYVSHYVSCNNIHFVRIKKENFVSQNIAAYLFDADVSLGYGQN